ncbi:LysR family transcriptional regulator [Pseudoclavibacter helvolus]|uniref:LysR family transcriptional regulator n=1 Tax=Pseudoclavibacter helvolus TaxID=255205 RepID=UPI003C750038
MEFRHLELLRDLSMRGTLAAVAAATHRTPSAVSQQLKTAERELGVRLVEPFSRGLRLTAAGQILADGADDVGRALAAVQGKLEASLGEPSGTVSIGALPSASEALFPGLLQRTAGSAITLELDDFDLAESEYATRTLDADIVIGHSLTGDVPRGAEHLQSRVLAREPIDVALPATHPLAALDRLAPGDLVGTAWVGVPLGYPFDSILIAVENATSTNLDRLQRLRDNRLVEALVATGAGLALLPRFTTRPRPGVVLRPLDGVRSVRSIVALARPDRHARYAVRTVLDHLTSAGAELEAQFGEVEPPRP